MVVNKKVLDRMIQGFILGASILTMTILLIIVGYTVYRGVYSNTISKWDVIPKGEVKVELDGREYFIIANSKLKLKELAIGTLLDIKRGRCRDWGLITGQDSKIKMFTIPHLGLDISKSVNYEEDEATLIDMVSKTLGAIGFLPVENAEYFGDTNIIGIRRTVLAVNSTVLKQFNNKKLKSIDSGKVESLLKGQISSWAELGGPNIPVRIIIPPVIDPIFNGVNNQYSGVLYRSVNSIHTSSIKEFYRILSITDGGVAPVDYRDIQREHLDFLSIIQHDKGRNLTLDYIIQPPKKSGRVGGVSTIILNTIIMILMTIIFTVPLGLGAAIYLTNYSKPGKLSQIIRGGIETLAGVPSIIFGLFGFIFFVETLKLGAGLLSGTLTISLMILPTIIRTSEEALKTVPEEFYLGSLALGASKWQSISRVVVPAASPGIISGIILGLGRSIGETAALLFTMGSDYRLVTNLTSPARVLSVHLYLLVKEGISFEKGFATATILIVVILIMNLTTTFLISRIGGAKDK